MVEGRPRSHSDEHSTAVAITPSYPPMVGSLTPDRSSRLQTSKTPHHRTNFPYAYKPPVPPGYEPPPNPSHSYRHPLSDSTPDPVTDAFAAAMRVQMDGISALSDIVPFDQAEDGEDSDAVSQPGRINPAASPPTPRAHRAATPTDSMPMVSPPTTGYRSHSPVPTPLSSTEIRASSSYRSQSPSPLTTSDRAASKSRRTPIPAPGIYPSRSQQTNAKQSNMLCPMSLQTNAVQSNLLCPVASSPSLPFDEALGRVTPTPTNAKALGASLNRGNDGHRSHALPPQARASPLTTALLANDHVDPFDEPPSLTGSYRMAPPRVSVPMPRPYVETFEDEPSALTGDFSLDKPRKASYTIPVKASNFDVFACKDAGAALDQKGMVDQEEDDDSLFDFEERSRRDKNEERARKTSRSASMESDDTSQGSQEEDPDNLQQRAQSAWKRKKRSAAAERNVAGQTPMVSFGKDDIVHNYDPNDSVDASDTFDNTTLGGHSLNSLYTKSAESEVEDIIKDIFMIGSGEGTNPGRRKFKHNPRVREKIERRSHQDGETTDEDTDTYDDEDETTHEDTTATFTDTTGFGTINDSATEESIVEDKQHPTQRKTFPSQQRGPAGRDIGMDERKEDGPLTEVWAFVENKFIEVGAVLGLEHSTEHGAKQRAEPSPRDEVAKENVEKSGWDIWHYLLGPPETPSAVSEIPDSTQSVGESTPQSVGESTLDVSFEKAPSHGSDVRLVELAVQAAMSMHRLNGFEFDSSYDIDILNDVEFCVVDLALPLGVIFQENEKGCWVTQILPDGSAASSGGNIQVGDQLAAVDGASAIDMTVDEIAKLIRVKKMEIELTFVRYIGPLRPEVGSVVLEEGYEISATETPSRKKLPRSPPPSPKKNKVYPVKPANAPIAIVNSPKGILKQKSKSKLAKKAGNGESASPDTTPARTTVQEKAEEPKKRFRLFGRRK